MGTCTRGGARGMVRARVGVRWHRLDSGLEMAWAQWHGVGEGAGSTVGSMVQGGRGCTVSNKIVAMFSHLGIVLEYLIDQK